MCVELDDANERGVPATGRLAPPVDGLPGPNWRDMNPRARDDKYEHTQDERDRAHTLLKRIEALPAEWTTKPFWNEEERDAASKYARALSAVLDGWGS